MEIYGTPEWTDILVSVDFGREGVGGKTWMNVGENPNESLVSQLEYVCVSCPA